MRPLKFRQLVNGEWHYWGFIDKDAFVGPVSPVLPSYQFTGLCDKKGKEGYHKDICKIPAVLVEQPKDITGVIRWMERAACFYLKHKINKKDRYLSIATLPEIEIIGNVFQNKDLLKEKP